MISLRDIFNIVRYFSDESLLFSDESVFLMGGDRPFMLAFPYVLLTNV